MHIISSWPKNKSCSSHQILQLCFSKNIHAKTLWHSSNLVKHATFKWWLHYLALVMNTKVVHLDMINMFNVFLRSHKHFIHWLHIILPRSKSISSLRSLISLWLKNKSCYSTQILHFFLSEHLNAKSLWHSSN